ncbi:MAG TPA: hypothetical protein QGG91_04040, partial [Flavobacteriales bacterium]|nr:hypothetical protein [Flavobacteriales bacterium]
MWRGQRRCFEGKNQGRKAEKNPLKIPRYSTVTKSLSREDYSGRKVNLLFDVNITDKNLNNYFYSEHQQYLYDTIKELHGKGLGYRKISNWFNERNIKTP